MAKILRDQTNGSTSDLTLLPSLLTAIFEAEPFVFNHQNLIGVAVVTMTVVANRLVSVHPEDLTFHFELEKHSYCDLKITNNTENHVAFKVKTTSPKKYFVRPNTGVIHPWDSSVIRVTLQAQREYPPVMQCKDKFLLQSTIVPPNVDVDQLPQDTFNKEGGRTIEERKLKVVYISPNSTPENLEDGYKPSFDTNPMHRRSASSDDNQALQHLKDERDAAVQKTKQLQKELEILKSQRSRKSDTGLSIRFALLVGLIGIVAGWLLNLLSSSSSTE
ncbi:Vesicle-associated protein 2-1 [Abeliophyllum distichum]|uniref:Vesicle-associated protein 2-1 n=1 Tax=Abeliophyllum distichum TaxID=126358 RepID=A0ABD1QA87_9LAMI